ncbi:MULTISPECIES: response regulator [Bacillus]|uniref:response regulator n=1 Tax=Bacillus TaxID=1386 RepID=UPI0002E2FE4F|nr:MULTISPECIES: response regulator [Bacillus]
MYNLMIVEDEIVIRAGLVKYFNWGELGFSTILEAENGLDAIEKANKWKPDLIVTDIRMPNMDGLKMIERLQVDLPDCIFVILSGYEDFIYAKKAIQLGVTAYLVKPLQYEESIKTIQEAVTKMKEKKQDIIRQEEIRKELSEKETLMQEKCIQDLMENNYSEEEWKRRSEMFNLPIVNESYYTVVFTLISKMGDRNSIQQLWGDVVAKIRSSWEELFQSELDCQVFIYTSGMKCFMFIASKENPLLIDKVTDIARKIVKQVSSISNNLYCGVGPQVNSGSHVKQSLLLAQQAITYRFFDSREQIFYYSQPSHVKGYLFHLTENQKQKLVIALEQADQITIKELLGQFEQLIEKHAEQATPEILFAFVQELIGVCIRFVHKHGINIREMYHTKLFSSAFLDDFCTLTDLFEWLTDFILTISLNFDYSSRNSMEKRIFSKIEAYILENIDKDISLTRVANVFFYNPTYLSRLFKNKMNINYVMYITEIRMNYAKECLKNSNYSVLEVANMCGYNSYKHFVKTFKKITGITPSEYRKMRGVR